MKKVLVSLLVLALATAGAFAAVNFSGELVTGYNLNIDKNGDFHGHVFGQDGTDTNTTKLNLGVADDNGVWTIGIEGILVADGRVSGDITVDLMKLFAADSDISLKLGLAVNDEQTVLRAYSNQSGKNFDRIRTAAPGLWASLDFTFANLVEVKVAGSPATAKVVDGGDAIPSYGQVADNLPEDVTIPPQYEDMIPSLKPTGFKANGGDVAVSALVTPLDGLKVSAGWVLYGDSQNKTGNDGAVTAAADVNVGSLVGLDFDLGVAASYIYGIGAENHVVAATVYGGVDAFDAYAEYSYNTASKANFLVVGANVNVVENMLLDFFVGANDLGNDNFGDTFFVGGDIGYTVSGVTFQLGVEYAAGDAFSYDETGLSIVPQVKVAF